SLVLALGAVVIALQHQVARFDAALPPAEDVAAGKIPRSADLVQVRGIDIALQGPRRTALRPVRAKARLPALGAVVRRCAGGKAQRIAFEVLRVDAIGGIGRERRTRTD